MAGTVEGGRKAALTNKKLYGMNFYNVIGRAGGAASTGGGWQWMKDNDPEKFWEICHRGGTASRRPKKDKAGI